jgi:hypothetical protein
MKTLIHIVIVTILLSMLSACVAAPPYGNPYYGSPYYGHPYYGGYYRSYPHHGGWRHHW